MTQSPLGYDLKNSANKLVPGFADSQGSAFMAMRHGKYYEGAFQGTSAWAANQALDTLSAGLATTYTGICLSNPAGSNRNLSVQRISGIIDVAPAAVFGLGLIVGFAAGGITVHTTPLTVGATSIGASAAALVGLVDAACTLVGTPAWREFMAEAPSATGTFGFINDLDGAILLPPGGYMAIGSTIAGPTSGFFGSISWDEMPLT